MSLVPLKETYIISVTVYVHFLTKVHCKKWQPAIVTLKEIILPDLTHTQIVLLV